MLIYFLHFMSTNAYLFNVIVKCCQASFEISHFPFRQGILQSKNVQYLPKFVNNTKLEIWN